MGSCCCGGSGDEWRGYRVSFRGRGVGGWWRRLGGNVGQAVGWRDGEREGGEVTRERVPYTAYCGGLIWLMEGGREGGSRSRVVVVVVVVGREGVREEEEGSGRGGGGEVVKAWKYLM